MTKPKGHIEEMHTRLNQVATREQLLIQALGDALSRADKKLLDDVRNVTIEHENRRALILSELQTLAARIGAFPTSEEPTAIAQSEETLDLPYFAPYEETNIPEPEPEPATGADWRQAAQNITDEFDFPLNGAGPSS